MRLKMIEVSSNLNRIDTICRTTTISGTLGLDSSSVEFLEALRAATATCPRLDSFKYASINLLADHVGGVRTNVYDINN